jgi:hypothetical protein
VFLRLNPKNVGEIVHDYSTPYGRWFLSEKTDVAVVGLRAAAEDYDVAIPDLDELATDEYAADVLALGSDVVIIGLFSAYIGSTRSEPVLRFGRVSLLPQEGIEIEIEPDTPIEVRAMLVESLSWGGESGSPVIAGFENPRVPGKIVGLVHGHYNIPRDVRFSGDVVGSGAVDVNAGMAVVIPSQAIRDLLNREDVVEQRKKAADQVNQSPI